MRRKMVIANRKMHGNIPDNQAFLESLLEGVSGLTNADYAVCLPHPYHFQAQAILTGTRINWGGQTMSRFEFGAHTGSTSPLMLLEFGCKYVIIGHSERRLSGYESDEASGQRFEEAIELLKHMDDDNFVEQLRRELPDKVKFCRAAALVETK